MSKDQSTPNEKAGEKLAIDNPSGAARPEFNQYEVNQPQNMDDDTSPEPAPLADPGNPIASGSDMGSQPGYGNARTEDGEEEEDAATPD